MEVNALVLDRNGRPLEGLTRDDFTVFEDGKPQAIELFAVEGRSMPMGPARPGTPVSPLDAAPLPSGEYSNRAVARAGGVTVIVLDRLNTRFEDQKQARDQIVQFLKNADHDDRIALYVLESESIRILHDFTRDAGSLIEAMARFQARTSQATQATDASPIALATSGNPAEDAEFAAWLRESTQEMSAFFLRRRAELTNRAFITIANRLAGVRGRKNLVWVSSAFPLRFGTETLVSALDEATRAINSANIAIYAVDARGLTTPVANAASTPTQEVNHARKADADFPPSTFEAEMRVRDTMMSLADATGGRTFSMGNDISKAIRLAVNDARLTYVLGYYPAPAAWDDAFHTLKVTVNRTGATVRSRRGYYATRPEVPDAATSQEALLDAMRSPIEATGLGLSAHVEKTMAGVNIVIRPAVEAVSLTRSGDTWVGTIDVAIAQTLPNGRTFKTFASTVDLVLTDAQHNHMLRDGFSFDRMITLRPDSHRLHIVVRDVPSGAIGSVIVPTDALR